MASVSPVATAPVNTLSPTASPFANIETQMRDLETRMDSIFADSFRGAGDWFNQSTLASSVDLREQNDKYVARVYLPNLDTSKVNVRIDNGALHIAANSERNVNGKNEAEHYEQTITLPKPIQSDKMKVDRKQDLLVITVPKEKASTPAVASTAASPAVSRPSATATDWANSISNEFARMRAQMDEAFRDVSPSNFSNGTSASQLESAVKVDDQKDKYVVHFYLPDENLSNVNVKFENGQLDLTASEKENSSKQVPSGTVQSAVTGQYAEMITLPGPVQDKGMKVDRQANAVVVILPKA